MGQDVSQDLHEMQETSRTEVLARDLASQIEEGPTEEDTNVLHLPHLVLEQLASCFDSVRDLLAFASTCRAALNLVCSRDWPTVKVIQLLYSVPATSVLNCWLKRCSSICEVHAENCGQLSNQLLLALSDLPIKVLKLNGCWRLEGNQAQSAVKKIAKAGCLEVLDVRDTGIDIDIDLLKVLSICPNLHDLCAPALEGAWHAHQRGKVLGKDLLWPSLTHMHFTKAHLDMSPSGLISPKKLRSLVFDEYSGIFAMTDFCVPALTDLTVKRADLELVELSYLCAVCPKLKRMDLSGCATVGDNELKAIQTGAAADTGRIKELILRDLQKPSSMAFRSLLKRLGRSDGKRTPGGFKWDFSGCANIDDDSFAGYAERFVKRRSKGRPNSHIEQLRLSDCWRISHALLSKLASIGSLDYLQVLDMSNVAKLTAGSKEPQAAAEITAALCAAVSAAGRNMVELNLNAATVTDELLAAVGRCCERLESLSIIGCRPFTDAGLEAVAQGCPLLKSLSVGGPSFGWREGTGLAAFTGLQQLTISRRSSLCTDSGLIKVLEQHPGLERFKLCMSSAVTDRALEVLPAESLHELTLVACDAVHGHSIARLKHLESLRLSSCSCITKEAVQVIALSCRRLRVLELPHSMPTSVVPVQASGHLRGLRLEGGVQTHRKGLRRQRHDRSNETFNS
ncbi:probable f-box/LRR-repeat protein 2 at C-terminar half [Coccomyxa sp. Obi]|nr:probable f-box/LRR-repeat protein 2 at C-terminar half [Coccomyxa sp. Obi]